MQPLKNIRYRYGIINCLVICRTGTKSTWPISTVNISLLINFCRNSRPDIFLHGGDVLLWEIELMRGPHKMVG